MSSKMTRADLAALLGKGILGALPIVGALAAEVLGAIIPNQRVDRIEMLLRSLERKLAEQDEAIWRGRFTEPEYVDLLEDGFFQSARALSDDKREHIASLLKNSLTSTELEHVHFKRLLAILGELTDLEILLLILHSLPNRQGADEFMERHREALSPPAATIGAPRADIDKNTVFESYEQNLVRLGLLKPLFPRWKKGEVPDFDPDTGKPRSQGYDVTPFGRLLLRSIDQEQ